MNRGIKIAGWLAGILLLVAACEKSDDAPVATWGGSYVGQYRIIQDETIVIDAEIGLRIAPVGKGYFDVEMDSVELSGGLSFPFAFRLLEVVDDTVRLKGLVRTSIGGMPAAMNAVCFREADSICFRIFPITVGAKIQVEFKGK